MDKSELKIENDIFLTKRGTRKQGYRNKILRSAKEIFLEKGFRSTSTDEIAARAGVTKRTLYKYYSSKLALYIAMYEDYLHALNSENKKISKLSLPVDQIILKYFETFYKFTYKNENFMRFFLWELDSNEFKGKVPDELKDKVNKLIDEMYRAVIEHVNRVSEGSKDLNIEPRFLIHVLLAMQKGISMHANSGQRFKKKYISADKLFNLFKIVLKNGIYQSSPDHSKVKK